MHGFDLAKHVYHNEGGWTDEPLGQERLWSPHCPQPGSCKLVRCIGSNTCLCGQPAPEEFFILQVTAEPKEIMLTVLGFYSYRLLFNCVDGLPMHTLHHRCHGTHWVKKYPTNIYNKRAQQIPTTKCCTWSNSQGARFRFMCSIIRSLRKTSLRRDRISESMNVDVAPWLFRTLHDHKFTEEKAYRLCEARPWNITRGYIQRRFPIRKWNMNVNKYKNTMYICNEHYIYTLQ